MRRIARAENNDPLVRFLEDYPRISIFEIAERLGCSRPSIYAWTDITGKSYRPAPKWTVEAIAEWRKELEAEKADRRGVKLEPPPAPAPAPKSVNTGTFLITVPVEKADALKAVVAMFGGTIVEMYK